MLTFGVGLGGGSSLKLNESPFLCMNRTIEWDHVAIDNQSDAWTVGKCTENRFEPQWNAQCGFAGTTERDGGCSSTWPWTRWLQSGTASTPRGLYECHSSTFEKEQLQQYTTCHVLRISRDAHGGGRCLFVWECMWIRCISGI